MQDLFTLTVLPESPPHNNNPGAPRRIGVIYGRIEDVKPFPTPLRRLNALVLGHLGTLAEPLWRPLLPLMGDSSLSKAARS